MTENQILTKDEKININQKIRQFKQAYSEGKKAFY